MKFWLHEVTGMSRAEIDSAIDNDAWQRFRLSLKGLSTEDKLENLTGYQDRRGGRENMNRVDIVRVDNYINALLRGGQLVRNHQGTIYVQR